MKQYEYICDGGSLKIGVDGFSCHYLNNYGDGEHILFVFDDDREFSRVYDRFKFIGCVSGKGNVYYYDCSEDVLFEFNGTYAVYAERDGGDMAMLCWNKEEEV